jgi:hypothetical protein
VVSNPDFLAFSNMLFHVYSYYPDRRNFSIFCKGMSLQSLANVENY